MNYKVSIEDLENNPSKTMDFHFKDVIEGINSVDKIAADLKITSLGEFIEITGNVKGTIKLECDLCLKEFEYKLNFNIDEMFAKNTLLDEYGQETELKNGQFVTDLQGEDEIDIYDLLYQSVILNFPNKKVCGINCKGKEYLSHEENTDPRLEVFKNLQINPKCR